MKTTEKAEAIRPIISNTFNSRGQVDLIDMQAIPIRCFKWILHYQDHLTKFSYLRAIINKTAVCVAQELLDIFLMQGCPCILQSDNGREFVNSVIRQLMTLWHAAKIVNGRARHPQSQGSVERSNQDVELMLGAMMKDLGTSDWPMCLPFIARTKRIIAFTKVLMLYPMRCSMDPNVRLDWLTVCCLRGFLMRTL